jgi:drug/metabolite transporter (DMT)-like permease
MIKGSGQKSYGDNLAAVFVIVAAFLWAVDGIVLRPVLFGLPVSLVVFTESLIAAVLITPFMLKKFRTLKKLALKDWLAFFSVAVFGGALGTMAITKALFYVNYVNLSIVILIQKLQPVFAITLAAIFLGERLPLKFFVYAGAALAGAYVMTFGLSIPSIDQTDKTFFAALFALLAAVSFGSSTVLSKRALRNVGFEVATYLRFLISTVLMLAVSIFSGSIKYAAGISSNQLLIFFLIALTTGGSAIFLYYYGLKRIPASVAAVCELAFPLGAIVLEYLLRGNILSPVQWIGAFVLFSNILIVTRISSANLK